MSPVRRIGRKTGAVLALVTAYAAGIVTGVVGSDEDARPQPRILDQAADQIAARAAHPVPRAELERAAVDGMLRALGDRWASYYRPDEFSAFQAVLDGRTSGVGVWVRRDRDGRVRVASVQPGSPAAAAGLRTRDEVVAVGDRPVAQRSVADVVTALRGSPGSAVVVRIRRAGVPHTVRLRRADLRAGDVTADTLPSGVLRIRVAAFTHGVGRRVRQVAAEQRAHPARAVILDMRDNPGGLLDEAVETASAFLAGGPVVSYERRGAPRRLDAIGAGDTITPLVVLVNGSTASAAEVVAGALQDRRRAVVVGARTFGKGSVQEPARLPDGSALELTVGRYRTPGGRLLDGVGVEPDVEVPPNSPPQVAERRALEVLAGLLVDTATNGRG